MPSPFAAQLRACQPTTQPTRWIYVPYDQLSTAIGPLSRAQGEAGVVLIESRWKARQRLVHQQKLYLILANQRQFALELAREGVRVDYRTSDDDYATVLDQVVHQHGPVHMAEPAERELRENLRPLVQDGRIVVHPHDGWLTTVAQFQTACPARPYRMDAFYRRVRRDSGILMDNGKPRGGRFSHDGYNREPWRGTPAAPEPPRFEPDAVDREVADLIRAHFAHHPGRVDPGALPTTRSQALALWTWACRACLTHFGPYEDAMSVRSKGLFHTRIAPLLHLHRLLPAEVLQDALALDLPLNSVEGFVRQLLGWREFVRHVHRETDGFRLPGTQPTALTLRTPLPAAWWGAPSGLACLDRAVEEVWEQGWTHHIPRLMVLSNLALLLDVDARALTDWFWVAFTDAFDWVVEPNVLGMGTFAVGEVMTTKPYIAGSTYLNKMGDACKTCTFHPKKTCPITPMYWAWLARHEPELRGNHRLARQLAATRKRSAEKKASDRAAFERVRAALTEGKRVRPDAQGDLLP